MVHSTLVAGEPFTSTSIHIFKLISSQTLLWLAFMAWYKEHIKKLYAPKMANQKQGKLVTFTSYTNIISQHCAIADRYHCVLKQNSRFLWTTKIRRRRKWSWANLLMPHLKHVAYNLPLLWIKGAIYVLVNVSLILLYSCYYRSLRQSSKDIDFMCFVVTNPSLACAAPSQRGLCFMRLRSVLSTRNHIDESRTPILRILSTLIDRAKRYAVDAVKLCQYVSRDRDWPAWGIIESNIVAAISMVSSSYTYEYEFADIYAMKKCGVSNYESMAVYSLSIWSNMYVYTFKHISRTSRPIVHGWCGEEK